MDPRQTHRRLVLMRHAKSDWTPDPQTGETPPDHARALNARGRRDAPRMARWLQARGWHPDAVISSSATRTRQTWALASTVWGHSIPTRFEDRLYLAGLGALQDSADGWDPTWETVLALGHNPGWEEVASRLAGERLGMVTATCVLLETTAPDWASALAGSWRLDAVMYPKGLPG